MLSEGSVLCKVPRLSCATRHLLFPKGCSPQGMVQPQVVLLLVPLLTAPSWAQPSLQQRGRIWVMSTEVSPAKCCALCQELEVHSTSQNEAFWCVWFHFVHFPSMQPHTT